MDLIKETEAKFYASKADGSFNAENYSAALKPYIKAGELYESLGKIQEAARAYHRAAECYHMIKPPLKEDERKNFKESVNFYVKAAEKYSEAGKNSEAGDGYENAAKISDEIGETERAVEHSLRSVLAYTKSEDLLSISHAYHYTAKYYEKMEKFELAGENYERSAAANMSISDNRRAASNYIKASECFRKIEDFSKAINSLANAANAYLKLREYANIAELYEQMADLYLKINDLKNSAYYHKKAAELSFDNKDYAGVSVSYLRMGELYESNKDYENALKYYLESAEAGLKAKNHERASSSYEKVGDCYSKLGEKLKASEYYVYAAKTSVSGGKADDAVKTYTQAARNFIENAESEFIEQNFENAAVYYLKASECFAGMGDYESAGAQYVKIAGVYAKAGDVKKSKESYVNAAENYLKAKNEKSAGYYFKMAGEYEKSALHYVRYADKKTYENNDIEAAEGFRLAAKSYVKVGLDVERRDCYTKALFHYEKITKDKKTDLKLKAEVFEKMGECHMDISDFKRAEENFQQAANLHTEIKNELGSDLSSAFLNEVRGQNALDLGDHSKASEALKESLRLFEKLIASGRFSIDVSSYLKEQKSFVENMIYKIEVKPDIELLSDKHSYTFTEAVLVVNGLLNNNGNYAINGISFLSHLPDGFEVVKLPRDIKELKPKETVRVSAEITVKKPGEYVLKPFEIFYRDEKGNKYVKSSNEAMISVENRPPEDFKNFRMAVEIYYRYGQAQMLNKNFFYAGDGFKKAAEIYGRFNTDEKLKEYLSAAIDAFTEYTKSEAKDTMDFVLISRMGDAFWNIAECHDLSGDTENALKNYKQALSYFEKSNTLDKLGIGQALISEVEAKKEIEHGELEAASEKLSGAIARFNETLKKGGLTAAQLSLIEKHNSEAKTLIEKIKGTPVVSLNITSPTRVGVNQKFKMNALLVNPGESSLKKVRFMLRFPENFVVEKAPTQMFDMQSKESQNISIDLVAKKAGEYLFNPMEMSYTDERNNSYIRGSNQISINVVEQSVESVPKAVEGDFEKPLINVILKEPQVMPFIGTKIVLEGVIENEGSVMVSSIRFLASLPQEFEVDKTPEVIQELAAKSKQEIALSLIPRKEGEYTLKPIEIFYRDAHGNRYFKGSNEVKVKVIRR